MSKKTPGRPRDPETDQKIIEATLDIMCESGYPGTTIEAVAAKAGVGRPTIYRRYSNRKNLVVAATRHLFQLNAPKIRSVKNGREEVLALLRSTVRMLTKTRVGPVFRMLIPYFPSEPSFQELAIELAKFRRAFLFSALERAQKEGFIHRDKDLNIFGDALNSTVYFTFIKNQGSLNDRYVTKLFDGLRQ